MLRPLLAIIPLVAAIPTRNALSRARVLEAGRLTGQYPMPPTATRAPGRVGMQGPLSVLRLLVQAAGALAERLQLQAVAEMTPQSITVPGWLMLQWIMAMFQRLLIWPVATFPQIA
jgi:hypothetical protein